MFSNRPKSSNLPANVLLILIVFSFGVIFLAIPLESPSREFNNKLGPRLLSPLLPSDARNGEIPVVIKFEESLTPEEFTTLEELGVQFRRIGSTILHNNRIYTARIPYPLLTAPKFLEFVQRIEYAGRCLRPQFFSDDSIPAVNVSTAWGLLLPENESVTGKGVTIGVIDTGIDWKQPDFYFADGSTADVKFGSDDDWYYADLSRDGGFQTGEDLEFLDERFDGLDATYDRRVDWLYQDQNGNNQLDFAVEQRFLLHQQGTWDTDF